MGGLDDSALLERVKEWQELQERLHQSTSAEPVPPSELSDAGLVSYVPTEEALEEHERQRAEVRTRILETVDT